jgi:hypothetical protein
MGPDIDQDGDGWHGDLSWCVLSLISKPDLHPNEQNPGTARPKETPIYSVHREERSGVAIQKSLI